MAARQARAPSSARKLAALARQRRGSDNSTMQGIRTNAAAVMLGVSPNTLRSWERRYGFPRPLRSPGGHRLYGLVEVQALRIALDETHNVSSAIAIARERGDGPSSPLRLSSAFSNFDEEAANRLLEQSLAVRSCERTIEEVLLAALEALALTGESEAGEERISAEYEFAWRHASGWLAAQRRLTPPATRPEGVLLIDASAPCDLDALHGQALELMLRRAGLRTLALGAGVEPTRLGRALRALGPDALVLSGRRMSLDGIGRLVYAVRSRAQALAVFDFRGAIPHTGASTIVRLGDRPTEARERLLSALARKDGDCADTAGTRRRGPASPGRTVGARRSAALGVSRAGGARG
jgi:DNA-binding transcriptional MerR regulator